MIKILSAVLVLLFLASAFSLAEDNKPIRINTGASYQKITSQLGKPIKETVTSEFWGRRKALYKLGKEDYCIIEYMFNRVKNILFLEQVKEEEALSKFNQ